MSIDKRKPIEETRIKQMVAAKLGLELEIVEDVMQMEKKVIYDNLTRGRAISKDGFFTITPKVRKSYTFQSGLDGKVYNVQQKYSVEIEPSDTLFEIMKGASFQSYERKR